MSKNKEIVITINEDGCFKMSGDFEEMELVTLCVGLIKAAAEEVGKPYVEFIKAIIKDMLIVEQEESN